ncbi:hypothetical protein [Cryptosporangium aurantiacum]|uniref:Uncharacterized protein n=1 Tax=Cryptosporangium aurantiacum TaxID=134849 RepID=A0A1M7RE86_9ACTN|nr:hypothetical protein [Cryptosporangium aurantiacum]SHN44544.1 hypothetical protein SAMN05443668_110253 [Cryptosporangium aurantiacum]
MNTWVRRGAGVVILSAGLVAAGSTAAQADDEVAGFNYREYASSSAGVGNVFNNTTNQTAGLIAVNVTAGNLQLGNAQATTEQLGSAFTGNRFGWFRGR